MLAAVPLSLLFQVDLKNHKQQNPYSNASQTTQMSVHDQTTYRKYTALTATIIKWNSRRFLTRGDPVSTIEGDTYKERMVI